MLIPWINCGLNRKCHNLFIESVQGLSHCVLSHKYLEAILGNWNSSGLIPQMSHDPFDGHLLYSPGPTLVTANERRFTHSAQTEHHFSRLCMPSLCSPLVLNLYFGFRTSTGSPGKKTKPLIGGDVSTLSPYGALNSTELLSNPHNMLRICSPCFSGENGSHGSPCGFSFGVQCRSGICCTSVAL